jgi:3-methyladenine DNA glycosylase AlkD
MSTLKITRELVEAMKVFSDRERINKMAYYAPTAMKVLGVSSPDIKSVLRETRGKYGSLSERGWVAVCKELVSLDIFECQLVAYEILDRNKRLLSALVYEDLKGLGRNLDNWASVDTYSVAIHGVLWRMGIVTDRHIEQLLQSRNHWDRRVAVVSTVALNLSSRGGTGDTPRTLWVCEKVADDRHDMIQKALSWALRELSKRDRDAVQKFMEEHGHRLAGRVVREVNHKLEFGTKN